MCYKTAGNPKTVKQHQANEEHHLSPVGPSNRRKLQSQPTKMNSFRSGLKYENQMSSTFSRACFETFHGLSGIKGSFRYFGSFGKWRDPFLITFVMINAKWHPFTSLVLELCQKKICPGFPTSSYTNWTVRQKRLARNLLFWVRDVEGFCYECLK